MHVEVIHSTGISLGGGDNGNADGLACNLNVIHSPVIREAEDIAIIDMEMNLHRV
ncbi:hypothetical protein [Hoylesella oralis]|uniref:hypothetical protein n=1 Tax=Hoylesella oralis TaxID=28134 RepID=UPI000404F3F5